MTVDWPDENEAAFMRLRQKVEPKPEDPRFILTVHGTGYKFVG